MRNSFLPALLIASFFTSCKSNEKEEKEKELPVTVTSKGTDIAYNTCGKGDTTLLFVHGWCINKEYWEPQLKYFCDRYTVVAIDLPGFGKSGKNRTDWSFDNYADDVKAVIEQLKLKNVVLIGHSMSGDILLKTNTRYPDLLLSIVGIDNLHSPAGPYTAKDKKDNDDFLAMASASFDSTMSKYMPAFLFHASTSKEVVNRVMNDIYQSDSAIAISSIKAMIDVAQTEKAMMQQLTRKLYLVNSDMFPVKPDSLNKYASKGFKVELVPGTGHYPMIEKPGQFNQALDKVLAAIAKGQ